MIEVSEYHYDPETGEEHYENPAYLKPDDHSVTFNTESVTGIRETVIVFQNGRVVRGNGETILLWDPTRPRILRTDRNVTRQREVFIAGPEDKVICVRRLPTTKWEINRERRLQET